MVQFLRSTETCHPGLREPCSLTRKCFPHGSHDWLLILWVSAPVFSPILLTTLSEMAPLSPPQIILCFFNFSTLFPYGYSLISDSWLLITCTTFAITHNYLTCLLCLFLHIPFSYSHPLFSSPTSFFSSLFPRVDWKLCRVDENLCFKYMHTIKVY